MKRSLPTVIVLISGLALVLLARRNRPRVDIETLHSELSLPKVNISLEHSSDDSTPRDSPSQDDASLQPAVKDRDVSGTELTANVVTDQGNLISNSNEVTEDTAVSSTPHTESPTTQRNLLHCKPQYSTNVRSVLPSDTRRQTPIPFMGNYNCSTELCMEFLTEADCQRIRFRTSSNSPQFHGKCHFMNGANRPGVLLMSYPGSGNTWVRGLLEQATGICTGSVYHDGNLRLGGFNGEGIRSGTVLVAKSHRAKWESWSRAGILLVRNPFDAYVAEWNRKNSRGHVGLVNQRQFRNNPKWNKSVHSFSQNPWPNHFKWLVTGLQTGRRVLVVRYEDLTSDLMTQMKRMLEFLGVPYSDEALQRRMSNDFGKFHRQHSNSTDFDHYTPEQRQHIRGLIKLSVQFLKPNNNGETYGIEEYLR